MHRTKATTIGTTAGTMDEDGSPSDNQISYTTMMLKMSKRSIHRYPIAPGALLKPCPPLARQKEKESEGPIQQRPGEMAVVSKFATSTKI